MTYGAFYTFPSLTYICSYAVSALKIDGCAYLGVVPGIKMVWVRVERSVNGVIERKINHEG